MIKNCKQCNKEFKTFPCRIKNGEGKFCSKGCFDISSVGFSRSPKTEFKKGQSVKGREHWNWQGGITPLRLLIWRDDKYRNWRTTIFQRDNYTCKFCGIRSGKDKKVTLNADHINPFYLIIKKNLIKTVEDAQECKELWDTDNGRTLCLDCHKSTDTYAGRAMARL